MAVIYAPDIDERRVAIGPAALLARWRNCERRGNHYIVLVGHRAVCLHCLVTYKDCTPVNPPVASQS